MTTIVVSSFPSSSSSARAESFDINFTQTMLQHLVGGLKYLSHESFLSAMQAVSESLEGTPAQIAHPYAHSMSKFGFESGTLVDTSDLPHIAACALEQVTDSEFVLDNNDFAVRKDDEFSGMKMDKGVWEQIKDTPIASSKQDYEAKKANCLAQICAAYVWSLEIAAAAKARTKAKTKIVLQDFTFKVPTYDCETGDNHMVEVTVPAPDVSDDLVKLILDEFADKQ